jgi:cohesin complex subunit SA-1/2
MNFSSSARPFRHTATLAGLAVMNGLITVATHILRNLAPKQKQLDTEKKKAGSSKLQQISAAASNYQERVAQLEERMDEFFLGYTM